MRSSILTWSGIVLLVAGVARADEAFKPDEEGFIRNWLVLAPLPFGQADNGSEALGKQQVPDEAKLQPKEGDKIKSGDKEFTWKAYKSDSYLLDFNAFLGQQTEDSVGYAVCYLVADRDIPDLTMKTGSDDQAKVYLNGKEVFKNEEARPAEARPAVLPVQVTGRVAEALVGEQLAAGRRGGGEQGGHDPECEQSLHGEPPGETGEPARRG